MTVSKLYESCLVKFNFCMILSPHFSPLNFIWFGKYILSLFFNDLFPHFLIFSPLKVIYVNKYIEEYIVNIKMLFFVLFAVTVRNDDNIVETA